MTVKYAERKIYQYATAYWDGSDASDVQDLLARVAPQTTDSVSGNVLTLAWGPSPSEKMTVSSGEWVVETRNNFPVTSPGGVWKMTQSEFDQMLSVVYP